MRTISYASIGFHTWTIEEVRQFERALKYVVDDLDGENIVWNTDYPHPDAIDPKRALPDLDAQPISDEARRKILWDNSVKVFGPRLLA